MLNSWPRVADQSEAMSVPPDAAQPLVTCILTAYNYAEYVERAVASALGQTGLADGAVEIVAVDDGSTDGTLELLERIGAPVRVLRQHGLGPTVGTYRALEAARGRYVALLDADDEWLPGKLARQVALLEARPEVGLVYGDMEIIDGDGRVLQPSNFVWTRQRPAVGRALGTFLGRNLATTSTIMLRTEVARSLPPAPGWAWCRDWWMAAHVAASSELDCVTEPVTRYRMHGSNLSALDDGEHEKTLRLWHRDLRVRRIFLRELDLSSVTLDDIASAWERFVWFAGQVAGGRGVPTTEVLPVEDADRAEAAAALRAARAELAVDPLAAGHAAARALAADPFGTDAAALLGEARRRVSEAGAGRAPLRSVAQDDRLRELLALRTAVVEAADVRSRLVAFERFDALLRVLSDTGRALRATAEERDRALTLVAAGLAAVAAGRPADAADALASAVALYPDDEHARIALADVLHTLGGPAPEPSSAEARAVHEIAPLAELDGARAFVGLAWADELAADAAPLVAWAEAFDGDDDATLVIYAPSGDEAAVIDSLSPALADAGIGVDDERDLALVIGAATPEREAGLARGASVLVSRRSATAPFSGLAAVVDAPSLRERAERRARFDGVGRALRVAVKLCAKRWEDAARAADLPLAQAIADELGRRGHAAIVQVAADWDGAEARDCDVALHVRGPWPYVPAPGEPCVLWTAGAHGADVTPEEAARFAAVLTPADVAAGVDAALAAVAPQGAGAAPTHVR
jgi:glycosyltransferase involved in cell wall biosynthesis